VLTRILLNLVRPALGAGRMLESLQRSPDSLVISGKRLVPVSQRIPPRSRPSASIFGPTGFGADRPRTFKSKKIHRPICGRMVAYYSYNSCIGPTAVI